MPLVAPVRYPADAAALLAELLAYGWQVTLTASGAEVSVKVSRSAEFTALTAAEALAAAHAHVAGQ